MGSFHPEHRANAPTNAASEGWRNHPFIDRIRQHIELTSAELHSLWRLIDSDVTVKKRCDLVVDGYEYRKLCFVEDGFAARYKLLRNGKRQILNFVVPGDVIGVPGSFLDKAHYSVVAVTDLKMQSCSMNAYVQLCYEQPRFGLSLSWLAIHEAMMCSEHAINTGRRTPVERLAHFLMEMHSRLKMVGRAAENHFVLPLSQEVMSDALGLSVPHFNRTLTKLRVDGLIAVSGHHIELVDREALGQLGHFQPLKLSRIPQITTFFHEQQLRPAAV